MSFLAIIKEIERSYITLPKQQRIRIEKWIEKLVCSGVENIIWRRHRNDYAKLLLRMVISKKLSDPFHTLPPDGHLRQFPKHLDVSCIKDRSLDSHELNFWRGIYERLAEKQRKVGNCDSQKIGCCPNLPLLGLTNYGENFSSEDFSHINESRNQVFDPMYNMSRIEMLEQQLNDQKCHHSMQIQRLQNAHRLDMSSNTETSVPLSVSSRTLMSLHFPENSSYSDTITMRKAELPAYASDSPSDRKSTENHSVMPGLVRGPVPQLYNHEASLTDLLIRKPIQIDQKYDEFLSYIEEFQSEIHKLHASSPLRNVVSPISPLNENIISCDYR